MDSQVIISVLVRTIFDIRNRFCSEREILDSTTLIMEFRTKINGCRQFFFHFIVMKFLQKKSEARVFTEDRR